MTARKVSLKSRSGEMNSTCTVDQFSVAVLEIVGRETGQATRETDRKAACWTDGEDQLGKRSNKGQKKKEAGTDEHMSLTC